MLHKIVVVSTRAIVAVTIAVALAVSSSAQTESTVYTFHGMPDGAVPSARLIQDPAGNFYGTTAWGGTVGYGTVFKIDTTGKRTILHHFASGTDGANPVAALVRDNAGNLYGTTRFGGSGNAGTVFKIDTKNKLTLIYNFAGGSDGAEPLTALTLDSAGNLMGTTSAGGNVACTSSFHSNGCGVVFRLDTTGKETVLHTFGSGTDGKNPYGDLISDAAGNVYGTTYLGGAHGYGTVYKLSKNRQGKTLYSFDWGVGSDGGLPIGRLVRDSAGNFYGTTTVGGVFNSDTCQTGCGTIFRLDSSGGETILYAFTGGPDGAKPEAGLLRDTAGNLYATTFGGGANDFGTVIRLDTTGTETILYSFKGKRDGAWPTAALTQGSGGILYGTTSGGTGTTAGAVFKITQ